MTICRWPKSRRPAGPTHAQAPPHGATHLHATGDHERLWQPLRDEDYRQAQLDTFSQYEAAYRALKEGIDLYVARNGEAPEDDPRLCWLALRAGELSNEAKSNVAEAFEWVRERPLEDLSRIEEAIERLSVLGEEEFYKAALLVLWIEADRQAELPEEERSDAGARLVVEAVEARIPAGSGTVDLDGFPSTGLLVWLTLRVLKVLPEVDAVAVTRPALRAGVHNAYNHEDSDECAPMIESARPARRLSRSKNRRHAATSASMVSNSSQLVISRRSCRQSISIGFSQGL